MHEVHPGRGAGGVLVRASGEQPPLVVQTAHEGHMLADDRRTLVRVVGAFYPPFVLLVVVATGNHFFFDAVAGALVAVVAVAAAAPLPRTKGPRRGEDLQLWIRRHDEDGSE